MSVEDIQKVNQLAQELLKKGFVADRDEAVKKAQEMLNKEIAGNDVETRETDDRQNVAASGDSEERLRNIVERTKTYMESQLNGYKNALIALEKEIRRLNQEVEQLKSRPRPQPPKEEPKVEEPKPEAPAPQQPAPQPEATKQEGNSNPRTGNHKSDDVSIEKMFYFGNK